MNNFAQGILRCGVLNGFNLHLPVYHAVCVCWYYIMLLGNVELLFICRANQSISELQHYLVVAIGLKV